MVKLSIPTGVLFGALPFLDLLVSVNAETAHGRVTVLDGIPYYVGDIAVALIPEVFKSSWQCKLWTSPIHLGKARLFKKGSKYRSISLEQ